MKKEREEENVNLMNQIERLSKKLATQMRLNNRNKSESENEKPEKKKKDTGK